MKTNNKVVKRDITSRALGAIPMRTLQTALGFSQSAIDGKYGDATRMAVTLALNKLKPATQDDWRTWDEQRQTVLCLQVYCQQAGFDTGVLDGLWGPQTQYASEQLTYLQKNDQPPAPWRDELIVAANPNAWPLEREEELNAYYGQPGTNLVMLNLPYPMHLSYQLNTVVTRTQCNPKIKDSLERALKQVLAHYGLGEIQRLRLDIYGGGFDMRKKRGGTSLSTHAWGIAFDFDPDRNQLKWGRDRASFARQEYDVWWRCWEDEGWVSLGRSRNFDWMHVQAARV